MLLLAKIFHGHKNNLQSKITKMFYGLLQQDGIMFQKFSEGKFVSFELGT